MKQILALLLVVSIAAWYTTSSTSAVASQRLVQAHAREYGADGTGPWDGFRLVLALTTLQLLAGTILCAPLVFLADITILKHQGQTELSSAITRRRLPLALPTTRVALFVGALHFVGNLCTNTGFLYGSAALVQVIKLLEPIETLLLTAAANVLLHHRPHGISAVRAVATVIICVGTSLLLSQNDMVCSRASILFSLMSGICMATRNVTTKNHRVATEANQPSYSPPSPTPSKSCIAAAATGLRKFYDVTAVSVIPATALWFTLGRPRHTFAVIFLDKDMGSLGSRATVFHALFNLASLTVLSMVNAATHSLLNVGKRIVNVVIASLVFNTPIETTGWAGLAMAAVGGIIYCSPESASACIRRAVKQRKSFLVLTGIMALILFFRQPPLSRHFHPYVYSLRSGTV